MRDVDVWITLAREGRVTLAHLCFVTLGIIVVWVVTA